MSGEPTRLALVITAGGLGRRMAAGAPKQFLNLAGRPMLARTLEGAVQALAELPHLRLTHLLLSHPVEACRESQLLLDDAADLADRLEMAPIFQLVEGGPTRQDSVRLALEALAAQPGPAPDAVLVHDGVRPLASPALYQRLVEGLHTRKDALGVVPLLSVTDTVKSVRRDARAWTVTGTVDREGLGAVQTPQLLRWPQALDLHRKARAEGLAVTDEAMLVERLAPKALLVGVEGESRNIKITRPDDLLLAEAWLARERKDGAMDALRVGQGFDVHAFAPDRPLVLGGVAIPHELGLAGHSDADVLLHAIADAVLGAAGLDDIGALFPDTEERWRGADSWELLRECVRRAREKGWMPVNVDATLMGQRPRIRPHVPAMRERIAQALELSVDAVNVKGTTTERLGFIGREEGLAAQAVVLMAARQA